eukprot:COSAG05_NODE_5054_length_1278_cov_0.952502_2_plen_74_part_01
MPAVTLCCVLCAVNKGAGAGYSALEYISDESSGEPVLVVVWEGSVGPNGGSAPPYGTKSTGTMWSYRLPVNDWC